MALNFLRITFAVALATAACSSPSQEATDAATDPPDDAGGVPRALTANDVSVLFPLAGAADLWPASLAGKGGPLLSRAAFGRIARSLVKDLDPADAEYAALRVVAVRFDPCFGGGPCVPQLRLVLQAIDVASGRAHDGAVHLLYNFTEQEWVAVVRDLRALTALAPENAAGLPLGPSPALASQGSKGKYGQGLRALVARHAGAANLSRMTFMTRTLARAGQWEFGGVNLRGFSPAGDMDIAGLPPGTRLQTVAGATSLSYRYSLTPDAAHLPALLTAIDGEKLGDVAPEALAAAYGALARVENPGLETPETSDCASCHLANRMRGYLDAKHPPATAPDTRYPGQAQAPRVVSGAEMLNDNLRAFGYFDAAPVVSQRTANETHHVLEVLETM